MIKKLITICILVAVLILPSGVLAADTNNAGYIEISDCEDLLSIKDNPSGQYILVNDIDMSGIDWKPIAFLGTLDGNGYALLNLTVNNVSEDVETTYDGNMKTYDTYFAGLFSTIKDATISNLKLINEKVNVTTDKNCFIGGIAGFSSNSTISNCSISGRLDLTVSSKMFGVAGVVGFGNGSVTKTNVDVTLVNIDTNKAEKDEQFLGGILGDGYMDIDGCSVNIKGYDSDHGYVHDGGIVGMYIRYPYGTLHSGYVTNCNVNGFISFFEDNNDRRAYCSAFIGETLGGTVDLTGNTETFTRDEKYEYDVDLKPEMCRDAEYTKVITESTFNSYGFTTYTCEKCGYTYTDDYTLFKQEEAETEATVVAEEVDAKRITWWPLAVGAVAVIGIVIVIIAGFKRKK